MAAVDESDWSYSGNPADSDKDAVRFLVGDVDPEDKLLGDNEVLWALTQQPNLYLASALLLDGLASRYTRDVDKRIGSLSVSSSQRRQAFRDRATELRTNPNAVSLAEVFCGGLSISGKDTLSQDTDAVQPAFSRGEFDNPRADKDPSTPLWRES